MPTIKKALALLVAVVLTCACPATTATHLKGDDPTVARAVAAEKALFESANTLFILEKTQQSTLAIPFKDLHTYTQEERQEVPRLLLTLRTYVMIYRVTTTSNAVPTAKPDIMPIIERSEAVGVELRGWLSKVAIADIPPPVLPARHESLLTTGNPYLDAAVQLITLVQSGLTLYQQAKATASSNGVLIDADENLFHVREDQSMASAAWQLN